MRLTIARFPKLTLENYNYILGSTGVWMTGVWMTIVESGWNLWMWLVGVVSRRWLWLVGGIYGCGYHEVGVVRM